MNSNLNWCLACAASAAFLAGPSSAQSQWVTWTDQTASRLSLSTVPVGDTEEKDMVAVDLDLDGDEDVVIVRKVPFSTPGGQPNVLLMNESGVLIDRTGSLAPSFLTSDDSRDILAFDANADGWPDLVTASTFGDQPRLWLNLGDDGNGNWLGLAEDTSWFSPLFNPGPLFCAVYEGDVDNDGDLDLYFSDYNSPLEDRLLINNGAGKFTDETAARFPTGANNSVFGTGSFICDFTMDGWADILKVGGAFEPLKLLINDGTGTFTQVQQLPSNTVYMARVADYNNDNRPDAYVVSDGQDYVLINNSTNPDGTINVTQVNNASSPKTQAFGGNVHQADVNRDGYVDVGVADVDVDIPGCTRRFAALQNRMPAANGMSDPNGSTTLPWNSQGTHDFAYLDIDGDGYVDLLQGLCSGYKVWMMTPFQMPGSNFCTMARNSSGIGARMGASGSNSIVTNDFRLTTTGVVPGKVGIYIYGQGQAQVPLYDGFLCIAGQVLRINPAVRVGGSGQALYQVDFTQPPFGGGLGHVQPGSTWNFQYVYRDKDGPGGNGANVSDGLTVTFTP